MDSDNIIDYCTESCSLCRAIKSIPKELFQQSTTDIPNSVRNVFSADAIKREKQKIIIVMDIFSSFVLGLLIPNEQSIMLEKSLIQLTASYKNEDGCSI